MCDYCDCRRIPGCAAFGEERDAAEELAVEASKPAKPGSPDRGEAIARQAPDELRRHIASKGCDRFPADSQVVSDWQWQAVAKRA
jgi:hypothetical protein